MFFQNSFLELSKLHCSKKKKTTTSKASKVKIAMRAAQESVLSDLCFKGDIFAIENR